MDSNNADIMREVPGNTALTDESNGTIASLPQTFEPAGKEMLSKEPILEAVHLKKDFPLRAIKLFGSAQAVHAVEDTSLALYPGRATALVGESGSGKTTVARLLGRLHEQTGGEIRFRGEPLGNNHQSLRAYRRHVQYIFQDPFSSLNPAHGVRYHLARSLRLYGYAHTANEEREQILALLERVNLTPADHFIDKFPHQLSGGQRQRIAIARVLAVRPSVILADEPVSMLDVSIRLDVLNLLLRLKEEDGLAFLFITHDIASARYFAEETLVMYAGQMVEGDQQKRSFRIRGTPIRNCCSQQRLILIQWGIERLWMVAFNNRTGTKALAKIGGATPSGRGEPPSLINPPGGCRFHPRCPHAMHVCSQNRPERTNLGNGHWTHCFLYNKREEEA